MVVRLDRTRSLELVKCASSCFALLSLLARLGCTERSARLARTTITSTSRSVNDVEVRPISNLLVDLPRGTTASDSYGVSCSCDLPRGTTASDSYGVSCSCDLLLWL